MFVISYVIGDRLFLVDTCHHLMIYLDYFKMINLLMHERVSNFWHILFPTLACTFRRAPLAPPTCFILFFRSSLIILNFKPTKIQQLRVESDPLRKKKVELLWVVTSFIERLRDMDM